MKSSTLWIALTRPDNLINALAIAAEGRKHFAACRLLYERSSWWDGLDWEGVRPAFRQRGHRRKVPECRGLRDLPRFYRGLQQQQQTLAALRIGADDTLVALAGITKLTIALASAYPGVNKVLCVTVKKYTDASRPWSWWQFRPTTSGWLQRRVVEPLLGLRSTVRLKPWRAAATACAWNAPWNRSNGISTRSCC